jgi:hypothetical protein
MGYALNSGKCFMDISSTITKNQSGIISTTPITTINPSGVRDPNCIKYKSGVCI